MIPPGGLQVFVQDVVDSREVGAWGQLEAGDDAFAYRVRYQLNGSDSQLIRLTNLDQMEDAIWWLRQLKIGVRRDDKLVAALPYNISIDFTHGAPEVQLAVRYFSGDYGFDIVPLHKVVSLPKRNYAPVSHDETPDWKVVHVFFKGTNARGRRNQQLNSYGRVFLFSDPSRTQLVQTVPLIYPGTTEKGDPENVLIGDLERQPFIEAFGLFSLGKPLLVEHPKSLSIIAVVPREVILDLRGPKAEVRVTVRSLGVEPFDFDVHPSALMGVAEVFCARLIPR